MPAATAFLLTLALVPVAIVVLRRTGTLDEPTNRSSHRVSVPRGGGVAVIPAAMFAAAAFGDFHVAATAAVLVAAGGLALIGFADDITKGAGVWKRLAATLAVATCSAVIALRDTDPRLTVGLSAALGSLWIAGYTNSFNFMDGINGISGVHGLLGGAFLALAAHRADLDFVVPIGMAIAGASAAFLPYNWLRARVFLGDVGSYGLGGALAALAFGAWLHGLPLEACLFPFLPYLADTGWTVIRRVGRGQRFYDAHREHAYQRLCDVGLSHAQAAIVVGAASTMTALLGLVSVDGTASGRVVAALAATMLLIIYLSLPSHPPFRRGLTLDHRR